jgi:hypothetical protein
MSDLIPKSGVKVGGLSRKAQKLQALREKMAAAGNSGAKPAPGAGAQSYKAKASNAPAKKTTFQRKAV